MITRPDIETQRRAYIELVQLCCSPEYQEKIIPFLSELQDWNGDENEYEPLYKVIEFSADDNDYDFIIVLDWKSDIPNFEVYLTDILQKHHNGLKIDIPKYDEKDFLPTVFEDFDIALRKHGLQLSFIDTESDEYVIIVHRVADIERVKTLILDIGYNTRVVPQKDESPQPISTTSYAPQLPTKKSKVQGLIFWLVMLLLCPVFSYITYVGFSKEGLSFWVISIGVTNLGFYYASITSIIKRIKQLREE